MAETIRVGILGAGWPGAAHARGYREAGGFQLAAVADLIPQRRQKLMSEYQIGAEFTDARELIEKAPVDAVSLCLPTHLHTEMALTALKAGKHVICETPPAADVAGAKKLAAAAKKAGKVLMYALQRRFGPGEQAAGQAIGKGYAGELYHARASWLRTRGVPVGTGWYSDRSRSGGGAMIDVGFHMLDIAWSLLGSPKPSSVYAVAHQRLRELSGTQAGGDVEDAAFALIRFEGGKTLELAAAWAINQAPHHNGTSLRLYGTQAGIEVYTPAGAVVYRGFGPRGEAKETPLKPPKLVHHAAMMRQFKSALTGKSPAAPGPDEGVQLMELIAAIYKSAQTGKSVTIN